MMVSACLMIGTLALPLSQPQFTLRWTHSIERTEWRENWDITAEGLRLRTAAVKGSGAGMEPGENASLQNGWWVWTPPLSVQPTLVLAASGATAEGWTLCDQASCLTVGTESGEPITLTLCEQSAEIRR